MTDNIYSNNMCKCDHVKVPVYVHCVHDEYCKFIYL